MAGDLVLTCFNHVLTSLIGVVQDGAVLELNLPYYHWDG